MRLGKLAAIALIGVSLGWATALPTRAASTQKPPPTESCDATCKALDIAKATVTINPVTGPIIAANGIAGKAVGGAADKAVGAVTDSATTSFTNWVADAASSILTQIAGLISSSTTPDFSPSWWGTHYKAMLSIAAALAFPFLMLTVIQAAVRHDPGRMLRSFFVDLPLAFLLMGAAVSMTVVGLQLTDGLTSYVASGMQNDTKHIFEGLAKLYAEGAAAPGSPPQFLLALAAIGTILAGLFLFLELLIREAVIYIAVLFLPLALAAGVWPGARMWAKRLTETLFAAIISKFVIVAVLSIAASALASTVTSGQASVSSLGVGLVLLGLAAYSPYKLLRLIPAIEHSASQAMEGHRSSLGGGTSSAVLGKGQSIHQMLSSGGSGGGHQPLKLLGETGGAAAGGGGGAAAGAASKGGMAAKAGAGAAGAATGGALLAGAAVAKAGGAAVRNASQLAEPGGGRPPAPSPGPPPSGGSGAAGRSPSPPSPPAPPPVRPPDGPGRG